jgi:hypothetical protein
VVFFDSRAVRQDVPLRHQPPARLRRPGHTPACVTRSCSCSTATVMGPEDLPVTGSILAAQMAGGAWQKSIVVFPEGFCGNASKSSSATTASTTTATARWTAAAEGSLRRECDTEADCVGTYRCENGWCCSQDLQFCGPPDADCGNNREGHSEGGAVTLCSDGIDNDRDGRARSSRIEGCLGEPAQDSEADCKQGGVLHAARERRRTARRAAPTSKAPWSTCSSTWTRTTARSAPRRSWSRAEARADSP